MKKDEKACPKCAETIKLAAVRCKHCGAEFSAEDVEKHKEVRKAADGERTKLRRAKKIDEAINDTFWFDAEDLKGCEIRPHEIDEIADEVNASSKEVLQRAIHHGMVFVDRPRPLAPNEWPQDVSNAIDGELSEAANDGVVPLEQWLEIEKRHDVEGITSRIHQLGLGYAIASGEIRRPTDRQSVPLSRKSDGMDWPSKLGLGCGALIVIIPVCWIIYAVLVTAFGTNETQDALASGTSAQYQRCEAELKPKLEKCLEIQPESSWGLCREAYLNELSRCTE